MGQKHWTKDVSVFCFKNTFNTFTFMTAHAALLISGWHLCFYEENITCIRKTSGTILQGVFFCHCLCIFRNTVKL